jgi:hypothetical protein
MKYEKPELSVAESATEIVQGGFKGPEGPLDMRLKHSIGAYEADE